MLLEYAYTTGSPGFATASVVRPLFANTFPALLIGAQVAPLSVERYSVRLVLQITPMRLPSGAGHGCAEASQPALLRTMLHTDKPLNAGTAANEAPSSAER